jgi:hypothetical protein
VFAIHALAAWRALQGSRSLILYLVRPMKRRARPFIIAGALALALTLMPWIGLRAHIAPLRLASMILAAPAFLASTAAGRYGVTSSHGAISSALVFFVVAFIWCGLVLSPVLFGVRFLRLSRAASQMVAIGLAAVVTLLCVWAYLAGFPRPRFKPNQSLQPTAGRSDA